MFLWSGCASDATSEASSPRSSPARTGVGASTSVDEIHAVLEGPGPGAHTLEWPVETIKISRGFSVTSDRSPASGRHKHRSHYGIDIAGKKGTPIRAAQGGLVAYVGQDFHGFGRLILIEGADGLATFYAHLSKFTVRQGQYVKSGDQIGEMGKTGRATGVHLHFEVRKDLAPVDPLIFLK